MRNGKTGKTFPQQQGRFFCVHSSTRLTFAIAANEDDTLVRLLKNLNILNKKYPIFDFDFDGFDSRVPAYRSPYSS